MAKKLFDKAEAQAEAQVRYEALNVQEAEIRMRLGPIQEARDAFVAETQPKERAFSDQIKALNEELYPVLQEKAFVSKLLPTDRTVTAEEPAGADA